MVESGQVECLLIFQRRICCEGLLLAELLRPTFDGLCQVSTDAVASRPEALSPLMTTRRASASLRRPPGAVAPAPLRSWGSYMSEISMFLRERCFPVVEFNTLYACL